MENRLSGKICRMAGISLAVPMPTFCLRQSVLASGPASA